MENDFLFGKILFNFWNLNKIKIIINIVLANASVHLDIIYVTLVNSKYFEQVMFLY